MTAADNSNAICRRGSRQRRVRGWPKLINPPGRSSGDAESRFSVWTPAEKLALRIRAPASAVPS